MVNVLMVWMEANPSTMEKNHLMLNGLEKNGVESFLLGFCHSRSNIDYFEDVFSRDALYSYEFNHEGALYSGVNIFFKGMNNIKIMLSFFMRLFSYCRSHNCSCIVMPPQPLELTLPTIVIGKLLRIKIIPNIMEYYPALPNYYKTKNILHRLSWRLVLRYSDGFIVISKFLRDKLSFIKNEIFILPAILSDIDRSEVATAVRTDQLPHFIYSSSKAYDDLLKFIIQSLGFIKDEEFLLTITGKYHEEEIKLWKNLAKKHGVGEKINFSGFLSDKELRDLQISSTALLMPLINNDRHCARFPQKVLSYISLGRPLITTNVGDLTDYFSDGYSAIIDESATPEGFAKKIKMTFESPALLTQIAANGKTVVDTSFSDVIWGNRLKRFIENLGG